MVCMACKLSKNSFNPCIKGRGSETAKIMFIQDCPDEEDDQNNAVFSGKSCKAFKKSLEKRGITDDVTYYTSLVKCTCDEGDIPASCISECSQFLKNEIEKINPHIIVPMGNKSLKFCLGRVGLLKIRGNAQEVELQGRKRLILPTMNPKMVLKKPIYKTYILKDLDTLKELYENGMTQVTNVTYRYLETLEEVSEELARMKREAKRIVFDLETTGKSPYMDYSKIVCISLTDKSHYGVVIPLYKVDSPFSSSELKQVIKMLKELLENPAIPKSAHNGKFDIEWLKVCADISVANFDFDTILGHYIAISEEQGSQGLKSQAWEFTDMGGYDNELDEYVKKLNDGEGVKSRYNYDRVPWNILRTYAAADVDCCYRLVEIYKPLIDGNDMWKTLMKDILMPGSYALRDVEINGIKINMDLANKYQIVYSDEIKRITDRLYQFPEVLEVEREKRLLYEERKELMKIAKKDRTSEEQKKIDAYGKYKDFRFNWNSVVNLRELLYNRLGLVTSVTTAKGELSTNETAMEELKTQHEIPKLLLELRKINTLNNMFIKKLPDMRDKDDLVHSSFNLTGTVTGRLSSENPNMQQVPRKAGDNPTLFQYHNEPKALFISRFGENGCIVNADYCLAPDTEIHLINGKTDTIKNICDRLATGEQLYTYSINPKTEEIVVSKILAGRKTRKNTPTLKITLDNGKSVICTPDHKFLLRTGADCKAQNLNVGMSLMPFKILESGSKPTERSVLLEQDLIQNHKVVSIEPYENTDVYAIEVENNHNFPLACGIFIRNCALEMRIAAIISNDKKMTQGFLSGVDIHKANASYMFKVPIEKVTKDLRTAAKSLGFGTIYGKSGVTFAKDLYYDPSGKTPGKTSDWEKAKKMGFDIIDHFLGTFTGLRNWIDKTKKFAYKHGYVETMFGRRRRLPDLHSQVHSLKADAERQAINAPIQGTGSDLTMLSVIHINNWLKENEMKSLLVATVHDSIVFDVYLPELPLLSLKIKEIMEHVHEPYIDTDVPILTELELGNNYGNVFEVSVEECQNIITVSNFNEWLYEKTLDKYKAEVTTLKNMGWGYQEVIDFIVKYKRPLKELANHIIKTYEN